MAEDQDEDDDLNVEESSSSDSDEELPEYVDLKNIKYHDYKYCAASTS
jgi:hypothetical protein